MIKYLGKKIVTNRAMLLSLIALIISGCGNGNTNSSECCVASTTTSARGVILSGQSYVIIEFPKPDCNASERFLVQGIQVSPEVGIGSTGTDVVHLPAWAVSVPVYQRHSSSEIGVPLNAFGEGAQHVSASLPAGQATLPANEIMVRVKLLGGRTASRRFEFNIHITGKCGEPFVAP